MKPLHFLGLAVFWFPCSAWAVDGQCPSEVSKKLYAAKEKYQSSNPAPVSGLSGGGGPQTKGFGSAKGNSEKALAEANACASNYKDALNKFQDAYQAAQNDPDCSKEKKAAKQGKRESKAAKEKCETTAQELGGHKATNNGRESKMGGENPQAKGGQGEGDGGKEKKKEESGGGSSGGGQGGGGQQQPQQQQQQPQEDPVAKEKARQQQIAQCKAATPQVRSNAEAKCKYDHRYDPSHPVAEVKTALDQCMQNAIFAEQTAVQKCDSIGLGL